MQRRAMQLHYTFLVALKSQRRVDAEEASC
jgi:hypothetical protein